MLGTLQAEMMPPLVPISINSVTVNIDASLRDKRLKETAQLFSGAFAPPLKALDLVSFVTFCNNVWHGRWGALPMMRSFTIVSRFAPLFWLPGGVQPLVFWMREGLSSPLDVSLPGAGARLQRV